ncbi:reverse transcriptase domain-containing protein [Tanacetum coccineum]|uniref:Reverse transcriptase domain-containing protein n=1 Tax=Tanacetum coccineum TaxID=301880 RepID=A0ABQ5H0W5_9ASTR
MIFNIDSAMKHCYSNDDTCFSIDVIDEILEEDFDALLDEGSQILHSIEGTILDEKLFTEFDEFIAMTTDENSKSETEEETKFEKITINTDYKIKTYLEEPPTDLELKPLPDNLEYVIWKNPLFSLHKIQLLDDKKLVVQKQRRLNPNMQEVVKKEIIKLLDTGIIYLISDSPWVSLIHGVPKKYGITIVANENDEIIPTRTITGLEVDKAKINIISKLPPPTNIKGIRSFLGNADFYRRFIKDFSKIARPLTKLLEKDTPFEFSDECQKAFELLKEKLTRALVIISPNWNLPFELMCDANDFPVGAVLGQKDDLYLFKVCSDGMIRRCVSGPETLTILDQFHHGLLISPQHRLIRLRELTLAELEYFVNPEYKSHPRYELANSPIVTPTKVLESSGHVNKFADKMVRDVIIVRICLQSCSKAA